MTRRLSHGPQCSFPQSFNGPELKAAYRFFDNSQVDVDGVLGTHIGQRLDRMQQVPVVLAVQGTTESVCFICPRPQVWNMDGTGLAANLMSGAGTFGQVAAGQQLPFQDPLVAAYAKEIAKDELEHGTFLRTALGSAAVAMPASARGES